MSEAYEEDHSVRGPGLKDSPASLRKDLLALADRYHRSLASPEFVAGKTYIPASGKVVGADDLRALINASLDLWLTAGPFAEEFERKLAEKLGTRFARLVSSGSSANLLAVSALTSPKLGSRRLRPGDEVLTVAAAFPTTVAPLIQNRLVPVFVDISLPTANVDIPALQAAVGPKTRAIMLAHTLGNPFDLDAVTALAEEHGLLLIEDCCDALGAAYRGKGVGTFGDIATLSFYPAHQMTTGEGGAVFFNRSSYKVPVESFRDWGRDCWCAPGAADTCGKRFDWKLGDLPAGYDHKYIYSHIGYNLKATDMQAALGLSQLEKVDGFIARRRENFKLLKEALESEGFSEHFHLPEATPGSEPSWFGFLLTIKDTSPLKRREVVRYLESHRVGTRLLFAGNLTRQPAFEEVHHRVSGGLEVTDKVMNDSFWIGLWPGIARPQIDYMVETLRAMIKELA